MAKEPKTSKPEPLLLAQIQFRESDDEELRHYLTRQREQLQGLRRAWDERPRPPKNAGAGIPRTFQRYADDELSRRRRNYEDTNGFAGEHRAKAIRGIVASLHRTLLFFGLTKWSDLRRLAAELTDTPLSIFQIQAVADQLVAERHDGSVSAGMFIDRAPKPDDPSPPPRGEKRGHVGQVIDIPHVIEKPPSVEEGQHDKLRYLKKDYEEDLARLTDLNLIPDQFRRIREIEPVAFARLLKATLAVKSEADSLVPPQELKRLPAKLPSKAPGLWRDRSPPNIEFPKWLTATWGPWLAADLLDQASLGKFDPAARSALFAYCRKHAVEPASLVPSKFKRGVAERVQQLLEAGDVDGAYQIASRQYVDRIKKRMAQPRP